MDVRTITDDDIEAWTTAMHHGFLSHPGEGMVAFRRAHLDLDRTVGAFDGGQVVGTLRSVAEELTLPGDVVVPVAAITAVTVRASHRRRGVMTDMLLPELAACRDRGESVSILIAAEWPIYGRFGFGPASEAVELTVDARSASFLDPRPPGSIEQVTPEAIREHAPGVYEQARPHRPGEITRELWRWDYYSGVTTFPGEEPWKGFQLLYRDEAGQPQGYLQYKIEGEWTHRRPAQVLAVEELCALTPDAYHALWRYCCEADWIATVKAGMRSVDEPLRHLLVDGRVVVETDRNDFVWVRLLDVPAALSARRYLVAGTVTIEVVDPNGLSGGRFRLEAAPDGATCRATTQEPDLTMPLRAVGAAYLGGTRLRSLAAAGQVDEHTPGALALADTMFRGAVAPWSANWF